MEAPSGRRSAAIRCDQQIPGDLHRFSGSEQASRRDDPAAFATMAVRVRNLERKELVAPVDGHRGRQSLVKPPVQLAPVRRAEGEALVPRQSPRRLRPAVRCHVLRQQQGYSTYVRKENKEAKLR